MSKQPGATRFLLFHLTFAATLLMGGVGLVLVVLQQAGSFSQIDGLAWFEPVEDFFGSDYDRPLPLVALLVLHLLAYLTAYFSSFSIHRSNRPLLRLFMAHGFVAAPLALAAALGLAMEPTGAGLVCVAVALAWGGLVWGIERGLGALLERAAAWAQAQERYAASNWFLTLGILLEPRNPELRRLLGFARFETGDTKAALQILADIQRSHPRDPRILAVLEECYSTERMWAKALETALTLLEQNPEDLDLRVRAAKLYHRLKKPADAAALLEEILPVEDLRYLNLLLTFLLKAEKTGEAVRVVRMIEQLEHGPYPHTQKGYEAILELDPNHVAALEGLARLQLRQGQRDKGIAILEKIVGLEPQRHDLRIRLVQHYQESERLTQAEPHLMALIDAGQESVDVDLLYGDILIQREEYDQALLHFHYAEERYPDDYRFAYFLAQISFKTDALDDAQNWCDEAGRRATTDEARSRVANLRRQIDNARVDRDLTVWEERCRRDPDTPRLRLELIDKLIRNGMAERAVGEFETLLEKHPEERDTVLEQLQACADEPEPSFRLVDYLADLKLQDGDWDGALQLARSLADRALDPDQLLEDHCQRILRRNPGHIDSLHCLGEVMQRHEEWEAVLEIYRELRRLEEPGDDRYLETIFRALARLSRHDEALELGRRLIREQPHNIDLRLLMVHTLLDLEDYDEAYTQLQAAQSADYYHPEVVSLMGDVAARRREKRLETLARLIEEDPDNFDAHMEMGDLYVESGSNKKSIACYQRVLRDPERKNLAGAKLARSLARLRMFDLAEETLAEVRLEAQDSPEMRRIKALAYDVAELFETEGQRERALKCYKEIFRVDASYRKVVDKVEALSD